MAVVLHLRRSVAAGVAFTLNRKPEGIGIDWLGPQWLAETVRFAAFLLLVCWFMSWVKRND